MRTNRKTLWIAAVLALCFSERAGLAGPVGQLTTFTAGTTAKASEVNGNFGAVSTAVNDNNSRITTLEGVNAGARLTTLETVVTPAGNIVLGTSTTTAGNILKGTLPFVHNFGTDNTFIGVGAGNFTMTGGGRNTASGAGALQNNTTGFQNTAIGQGALLSNTTGSSNTASGVNALKNNMGGDLNTASGLNALFNNTTGSLNIAIGFSAGSSLTTGSNNIAIGNIGVAGESGTIWIGGSQTRTFIAGIRGVTTVNANAIAVVVDSAGQLGTLSSSRRVKDDIADMGEVGSTLMKLRPVTFHYKTDRSPAGRTLQYGLVAEEVAAVAPGLVAHSADGRIETVYYQFLAPMLLNEYQRQQRTIEAQTARIAELEQDRRMQTARIEALENQAAQMAGLLGRLERAGLITTAGR